MNKNTKIAIACAAAYAIVGFNTLGFKYHNPNVPLPDDTEWQRREARVFNSGFAAVFWPIYWPTRWSMQFWEPKSAPATNIIYINNYDNRTFNVPSTNQPYIHNYIDRLYTVPTNAWHEFNYPPGYGIRWTNGTPVITNYTLPDATNGAAIIKFITGSNIVVELPETNAYVH